METRKLPIVDENLRKTAPSNNEKSIAEVIIDGSYKKEDLLGIIFSDAFPDNKFDQDEANRYTTAEAMKIFAETIAPYLSDAELFTLTDRLIEIEVLKDTQAFRNETLTKPFLDIELMRCSPNTPNGVLSPVLLFHFVKHVYPMIESHYKNKIDENVATFIEFNLKIKGVIDPIEQINNFSKTEFDPQALAKVAPRDSYDLLRQYSLSPAKRHAETIAISTPTSSRKDITIKESNIAALKEQFEKMKQEKTEVEVVNDLLKSQLKQSKDGKQSEAIMKQITHLNAAGRIAQLDVIIDEIEANIRKLVRPTPQNAPLGRPLPGEKVTHFETKQNREDQKPKKANTLTRLFDRVISGKKPEDGHEPNPKGPGKSNTK